MPTKGRKSKSSRVGNKLQRVEGNTYLAVARAFRTERKITAIARLPRLGKKAPRCYEYLGQTLALLDQMACCA